MKVKGIRVTEATAIASLQRWFATKPGGLEMTPAEIYAAEGLDPASPKSMRWLSNKLSSMRHYDLFYRRYAEEMASAAKSLRSVGLTSKGKAAVKVNVHSDATLPQKTDVTPDTVLRDIRILRKKMPLWEVVFELRPKEEN